MTDGLAVFDNFSGGDRGIIDEWRAAANTFSGLNVLMYSDGTIGPRADVAAYPITGLANGALSGLGVGAAAAGIGAARSWFVQGTAVRVFAPATYTSQAVATLAGVLAITPGGPTNAARNLFASGTSYLTVYGDKIYKLNFAAGTVSAVAATPGGMTIAFHGDRLAVGKVNGVYFSSASAPDTWAGEYELVPSTFGVDAIVEYRNGLYLFATDYVTFEKTVWVITGTLGVDATLRQVTTGPGPWFQWNAAVAEDSRLVWVDPIRGRIGTFDGVTTSTLDRFHLPLSSSTTPYVGQFDPYYAAVPLRDGDAAVIVSTLVDATVPVWAKVNGVWTRHQFANTLSAYAAPFAAASRVLLARNGTAGATPAFYSWNPYLDRPAFSSDTGATRPAASSCTFDLPPVKAAPGQELRVRSVVVDYRRWDTGFANTTFDVTVTPLASYPGAVAASETRSYSEVASSASTAGTDDRWIGQFGGARGAGARITVGNMDGVAIRSVTVHYEQTAMSGVKG